MLLNGPNLRDQDSTDSQTCLTISQTIVFNCKKRGSTVANKSRHSLDYEPPLPLYIGMNVHTQTRSKKLITQLCQMGLSVSYDRILQLENQLATSQEIGLVCPIQLCHGLFTVGALDNLDHNPSSTTAKDSFHGTGISLFQLPTVSNEGYQQSIITLPSTNNKNHHLPEEYTTVPAVVLNKDNIVVPKTSDHTSSVSGHMEEAKVKEKCWLEHGIRFLIKDELEKGDAVSWASYHASNQIFCEDTPTTLTQLMPLFYEKAASAAMVKHCMDVQRQATEFLNPGQIPVTAVDAPLYALAKLVQWNLSYPVF